MNSIPPYISIIVPVYNVEKYLRKCLDSITNQTKKEIEIIFVNDGSTDNSLKILEEYEKADNRIKIISQKNQGLGAARNTGLKAAYTSNSKYIYFIDSDDYISYDYLEKMYNIAEKTNADIVVNDNIMKFYDNNKKEMSNEILKKVENGIYNIDADFIQSMCPNVWSKLYKKELILKNNIIFPTGLIHEDLCFNYKLLPYLTKAVQYNTSNYFYRQREGSLTNQKKKIYSFDSIKIFQNIYEYYKENNLLGRYNLPFRLLAYRSSQSGEYSSYRNEVMKMISNLNLDIKKMKSDKKLKLLLISPNIIMYRINKIISYLLK